ncbi:degenerin unc-8-like [Centruroides sculpturatus]|uniref:degenerin unc-8-like n=1 Tax=Centruroides sculpturatus TaxID=218467 RepID=UPI000C6E02DE|nr:degenerin unc-8-like [Centruroides sculpturatus]
MTSRRTSSAFTNFSEIPKLSDLFQDILENSILTGIPQIALAKKKSRKILKVVVLFGCIAGFLYQLSAFLIIYWAYPTLVDVQITKPLMVDMPSITICNRNGIRRTSFCKKFPSECELPNNMTTFCEQYPYVCNAAKTEEDMMKPKLEAIDREETVTRDLLLDIGHASYPLISQCTFGTGKDEFQICDNETFRYYAFLDIYQRSKLCHIINPRWSKKELKLPRVPLHEVLTIVVDFEPTEAFQLDRRIGGQAALHSPYSIINPFIEGFTITPSKLYLVHLKEIIKHLLPSPYLTNCTNYKKLWKRRLGRGPLSREMCIEECLMNATLDHCGCVKTSSIYPHYEKFCHEVDIPCTDKINYSHCFIACGPACHSISFEVNIQEENIEVGIESTNATTLWNQTAIILLFFKKSDLVIYTYRPKYESIEFFSYVGGYIGIWLGMSLIAVFDFLEALSSLVIPIKMKIKRACANPLQTLKSASSRDCILSVTPYPYRDNMNSQLSVRTRSMPRAWE